jgi:hypothetical protein
MIALLTPMCPPPSGKGRIVTVPPTACAGPALRRAIGTHRVE